MSIVKPSFIESLFYTFFNLDPSRPQYYNLVFRVAQNIFYQLGVEEKADELDRMIYDRLEEPLKAPLISILEAYYNQRFIFSKKAYCKIGEGIDARYVTRWEMTVEFEHLKNWCYDEISQLTSMVRFSHPQHLMSS